MSFRALTLKASARPIVGLGARQAPYVFEPVNLSLSVDSFQFQEDEMGIYM